MKFLFNENKILTKKGKSKGGLTPLLTHNN